MFLVHRTVQESERAEGGTRGGGEGGSQTDCYLLRRLVDNLNLRT